MQLQRVRPQNRSNLSRTQLQEYGMDLESCRLHHEPLRCHQMLHRNNLVITDRLRSSIHLHPTTLRRRRMSLINFTMRCNTHSLNFSRNCHQHLEDKSCLKDLRQ